MAQPFFSGSFFPGPMFGWAFSAVLFGLLAVAAYQDLKRVIVPKWITLPTLALGILFNLVRGGWVEASGGGVWSGFLFALAGFGTGFGLFLLMWLLGTCGGGDVKLFAALGAWVGPLLCVFILGCTIILVVLQLVTLAVAGRKVNKRRLTYSLPAALVTVVVLLWVFRGELHLA